MLLFLSLYFSNLLRELLLVHLHKFVSNLPDSERNLLERKCEWITNLSELLH